MGFEINRLNFWLIVKQDRNNEQGDITINRQDLPTGKYFELPLTWNELFYENDASAQDWIELWLERITITHKK